MLDMWWERAIQLRTVLPRRVERQCREHPRLRLPEPSRHQQQSLLPGTTTNKTVRIDDVPQVEQVPSREETTASLRHLRWIEEVLADVGRCLKSMSAASLKKVSVLELGFKEKLDAVEAFLEDVHHEG